MNAFLIVILLVIAGVIVLAKSSRMSKGSAGTFPQDHKPNPALQYIMSMPQDHITETLITELPAISKRLRSEAAQSAKILGLNDPRFVDCILDLELFGGFDKVLEFTQDKALASAYIDAIVFSTTSGDPGAIPTDIEFQEGGTEDYRGIAKYEMAKEHFKLAAPEIWLFGKEYSSIETGNAKDFAYVASIGPAARTIMGDGALIFQHMLKR